jgi:hypothetical protein
MALSLTIGSPSAWSAEPRIGSFDLPSSEANAFALQTAVGAALIGAGAFGLAEAMRSSQDKNAFVPAIPLYGWAVGGAVGGAASGLGLALFVDPQPTWWGAAAASMVGLTAGTGGALWLNHVAAGNPPNELAYSLIGLTLPVVTALLSSLTYQGIRLLTMPQPAPTPTPLQTPWPSPTPPVRLFL